MGLLEDYRYAVAHMLDHGRLDLARRYLFAHVSGRNPYFELRQQAGDSAGILHDVAATFESALQSSTADFDFELRLALLRVYIGRRIQSFPPEVIRARRLMGKGGWDREAAIRFAEALENPIERAKAFVTVAETDSSEDNFKVLSFALEALRSMSEAPQELVRSLLAAMPDYAKENVIDAILVKASLELLVYIIDVVPSAHASRIVARGLKLAREMAPDTQDGRTVICSAPFLIDESDPDMLIADAKARGLAALSIGAGEARDEVFAEALGHARKLKGEFGLTCLIGLIEFASGASRPKLLNQVLEECSSDESKLSLLLERPPKGLDPTALKRIVRSLRGVTDVESRAYFVSKLIPHLPATQAQECLEEFILRTGGLWRTDAEGEHTLRADLVAIAPHLSREQVIALCNSIVDRLAEKDRLKSLLTLFRATGGKVPEVLESLMASLTAKQESRDELEMAFSYRGIMGTGARHMHERQILQNDVRELLGELLSSTDRTLCANAIRGAERINVHAADGVAKVAAMADLAKLLRGAERARATEAAFTLADGLGDRGRSGLVLAFLLPIADAVRASRIVSELGAYVNEPDETNSFALQLALEFVDPATRGVWAQHAAERVRAAAATRDDGYDDLCRCGHWISLAQALAPHERLQIEKIIIEAAIGRPDLESTLEDYGEIVVYVSNQHRENYGRRYLQEDFEGPGGQSRIGIAQRPARPSFY